MSTSTSNGGGIGVFGLLGVLFVGLKLTGHIDWSWWLVTMPFWGGLALLVFFIILLLDRDYTLDVTEFFKWLQAALTKRLIYTEILPAERMTLMREIRIINESIEKIESAEELTHEDRRDKKRSVQND